MTAVTIGRADFADPALLAFLQAHLDDMAPIAPACSQHALDLTGLQQPGVRLWTATAADGSVVGTAALAPVEAGHDELKSMRTDPERRGGGIASALLQHPAMVVVEQARRAGRLDLPGDLELERSRDYGDTRVHYLTTSGSAADVGHAAHADTEQ